MFKAKRLKLDTNDDYTVVLLDKDAKKLGLQLGDRVRVCLSKHCSLDKKNFLVCELLILETSSKVLGLNINLKSKEVGLFNSIFLKLGAKPSENITIMPAVKAKSIEYIRKKFVGEIKLNSDHFEEIITDIILNRYSDIEKTFFVLACAAHQLDDKETIGLTKAMINAGHHLDFRTKENKGIVVDKHCIGGIPGNRTTMIVVPIVAAAGLTIPKTSSRAITSPAGTTDTMEVLAKVDLSLSEMDRVVRETGACMSWGGSLDLSPADDIIINVEHPLSIDSEGQMIASILSKKVTAGATHVLIDIPVGESAKYKDKTEGFRIKKRFEKVGKAVGLHVKVIITNGDYPIGNGIGPYLESVDVVKVLKGEIDSGLEGLRDKAIYMAGLVLEMGGVCSNGKGSSMARNILDMGLAYKKFEEIVDCQGRKKKLTPAKYKDVIKSGISGFVKEIDNKKVSKLAFDLGDPKDKAAGLYLVKKVGDKVKEGDILFEIHSNSNTKLKYVKLECQEESLYKIV